MSELHDMMARWARPGRIDWIGLRPTRGADIEVVPQAEIDAGGLVGDRSRAGKRAVTLMQAEHVPVIASCLGVEAIDPQRFRRNIHVAGINLAGFRGREVKVGAAILRITTICAPCSLMERFFGPGGYAAVRGHGGWCAEVVQPGRISLGDTVHPID